MNSKLYSLYIFLFSTCLVFSQNYKGQIHDAITKEPILGATITTLDKLKGTTSDANGYFNIETNQKKINISYIGYNTQEVDLVENLSISLQPAIENLQSIVVTASREASQRTTAPLAISKVSSSVINDTKPISAYEVVNKAPGVLMVNLNNEQHSMSIRQPMTTNAYFLYLEDGVPIRPLGVFNHNSLLEMNQFTVSNLEIVRGPVSSIYGAEAVGGAVNFISQRPTAMPTARIGIQLDQWGFQRVQYGGGVTINKLGIYAGGLVSKQRDSWITSSDYDKQAQYLRLEYAINKRNRLISTISYSTYNSQTSGSVDSIAFYTRQYVSTTDFTYRKSYSLRSRLTYEHDWNKNSQSFLTAFARDNKHGQNPSYSIRWTSGANTATGEINSNNFSSLGFIAQHTQKFDFLQSKLIAGAVMDFSPNDYWAYRIDLAAQLRPDKKSVEKYSIVKERPEIQLANYNADIHNSAAYLQFDFKPLEDLRISLGGRFDQMAFDYVNNVDKTSGSKQYSQFVPKIGFTYALAPEMGMYGNYSKGFSPPALTAIFRKRPYPAVDGSLFYYNLNSAQFVNTELGMWTSLLKHKIYADVAVYKMDGRNELLNIRQPDNSFDYQSAGKTLHKGIEVGLTYKPTSEFYYRFGGTYSIHKFVEFTLSTKESDALKNVNNKEMPSAPNWIWNTEINYNPKWVKGLRTSLEWQHLSDWYQNQINTVSYDGYDVLNYRMGYQWKSIEFFTNVLNLTDVLYAHNASRGNNSTDRTTFTPAAPRTFIFGIQFNLIGKK